MKKPPPATNEEQRLAALRALNILDTPPEERFDRITRLAKKLFEVPIALITLVDADRQWFKSCQGLSVRETPRDISFCGHAILSEEGLVVPDTLLDERFADNPMVLEEPGIRFYAGQPLRAPDGSQVGVLCIEDYHPRSWRAEDRELLRDLARLVEDQLHLIEISVLRSEMLERMRAEEALRQNNERLEMALRGSSVGVWHNEMQNGDYRDGPRDYVNVWEQLGYENPPAVGGLAQNAVHPDDRDRVEEAIRRYLAGETTQFETEMRLRHTDGSCRTMLSRGVAVRDATGKPIRFAGVIVDMTRLKLAEEELRRTTQLLQAVIDGTQDAVYVKARDGKHLMFNSAASRMVGKQVGEVLGRDDTAIFNPEDARLVMAHDQRVMASGIADTDEKQLTTGGVTRTYLASKSPYRDGQGNIIGIIGICHDITERKHIEEALRESEQRWRSLTETLPHLVWANLPDGGMDYASAQVEQYLGRSQSELLAWGWLDVLHPDDRERTEAAWRAAVAGQSEYEIEHRLRRFDGMYRWFKTRGVAVRDDAGRVLKWYGTCTDITTNIELEKALRQTNERLELALQGSNLCIWEFDMPDGQVESSHMTLVNVWELLGFDAATSPTDFPSAFALLLHPDEQERVGKEIAVLFSSDGKDYESEYRVRRKDGSTRWHLTRGTVVRDATGRPVRFIGSSADITGRKQAEEALRASEQRFRVFVDHAADAFFLTDEQGHVLDVNRRACESLGYTRDELIGMTPVNFVADHDPGWIEDRIRQVLAQETIAFEDRHRRKDGTVFPVEVRAKAFREGTRRFLVALARDVTDRKRAEEALRERERQLDSLMGHLPGLAYRALSDEHWTALFASKGVEDLTGYPADEFTSGRLNYAEIMLPEDLPATREAVFTALRDRKMYEAEHRIRHKDGSIRWIWARGHGVFAPDGSLRFIEGLNLDMTRQKLAEEALRESEERFRGTFENAAVGIAHNDSAGRFLRVNETYCAIIGYSREELLEMTLRDIVHPAELPAHMEAYNSYFSRGESPPTAIVRRHLRKDGSTIWVEGFPSFQRDASGRPTYAIVAIQDISARKGLEEELLRAKDAAEAANRAKSEFLASMSHEIRTPMNGVFGMLDLALDTELQPEQRHYLERARASADLLLRVINDILDFSKIEAGRLDLEPIPFSLRESLGEVIKAFGPRAHRKELELALYVHPDCPESVVGDVLRLGQVLTNLLGNAIKFTERGEVILKAAVESASDDQVCLHFAVTDTGLGISPDKQRLIFGAFVQADSSTTRRFGGTGLGLTISARLVELMGGRIWVESAVEKGSTFHFTARFGRHSGPVARPLGERIDLAGLPVLAVDDNETNRDILAEMLANWRMRPTTAGGGRAALAEMKRAAAAADPFPLVLLDAVMPDLDGFAVAEEIKNDPSLAGATIMMLTSADRGGELTRCRELGIAVYLRKPIKQSELLNAILNALGAMLAATETTAVPSGKSASATRRGLRVLVVEDNEFNQDLATSLLRKRGHIAVLAGDGKAALDAWEREHFDLILMDIQMPEMDGFAVTGAIRAKEQALNTHIPIIAVTAHAMKGDRERCLAAGMDEYLTKPIRATELWAAVDRVAGTHPVADQPEPGLLDPQVLLAVCGEDAATLEKICRTFQAHLPNHLRAVENALREQDAHMLREAAHKLSGMLAAFSSVAGRLASDLEDRAAHGRLEEASVLVGQLETMSRELLRQAGVLSLDALRQQLGGSTEPGRTN